MPDANSMTAGIIMAAVAQHERDLICVRTKAAPAVHEMRAARAASPCDLAAGDRRRRCSACRRGGRARSDREVRPTDIMAFPPIG